jgi:hypothetical protein
MKTRLFLIALIVTLIVGSAGCGQAPATPPSNAPKPSATSKPAEPAQAPAPTEAQPAATAATGETAELRLWVNESAPFKTAYQALIDAYTA